MKQGVLLPHGSGEEAFVPILIIHGEDCLMFMNLPHYKENNCRCPAHNTRISTRKVLRFSYLNIGKCRTLLAFHLLRWITRSVYPPIYLLNYWFSVSSLAKNMNGVPLWETCTFAPKIPTIFSHYTNCSFCSGYSCGASEFHLFEASPHLY